VLESILVHATAAARPAAADEAMDRARECLVAALARLADWKAAGRGASRDAYDDAPPPRAPEPRPVSRAWHRWRVESAPGEVAEEWTLSVDGKPVARVHARADGCRGHVLHADSRLASIDLPPVPEALREVERRLGLPYVLSVESAALDSLR
jgi:hypothetical protein